MKATQENIEKLRELFDHAIALKTVRRSGWAAKLGLENAESVADHSYAVSLISLVCADMQGIDALRVVRMSLLHDLAESITGDVIRGSIPPDAKKASEDAAMKKILDLLPEDVRGTYESAWAEYTQAESAESRLIRQIDKLEMALQATHYADGKDIADFTSTAQECIKDPDLAAILESILRSRIG